eukprot:5852796-Amphidinium_carterae.1
MIVSITKMTEAVRNANGVPDQFFGIEFHGHLMSLGVRGFLDDGSSDVEWDIRERLRREHKAFRRDEGQPTSTSSDAMPQQPQSPRTRIGTLLQVMQVLQDLGLKILSLHATHSPSGSQAAAGARTSSTTPIAQETGYEPPYPPTTDPVLLQIYRNDALSQVQQAQSLDDTIAQMEEEHKAFHEAIEQGIRQSAAAKAKAEPTPTLISQLPLERAEQVVAKYITEASERLAILMKLNGTVLAVNLLARVPEDRGLPLRKQHWKNGSQLS